LNAGAMLADEIPGTPEVCMAASVVLTAMIGGRGGAGCGQ
jgi:hypothetical protein